MTLKFEYTHGDKGLPYTGVMEDEDLSACTGKIFLYTKADVAILDGVACTVQLSGSDTHIYWTPDGTELTATTAPATTYRGLFQFLRSGVVESVLPFQMTIFRGPF